jgi:hypothetical protein
LVCSNGSDQHYTIIYRGIPQMKPLKELEYYMHNGEKVYYAKEEDIKSAVEWLKTLIDNAFPALYSEQTKEGINDD